MQTSCFSPDRRCCSPQNLISSHPLHRLRMQKLSCLLQLNEQQNCPTFCNCQDRGGSYREPAVGVTEGDDVAPCLHSYLPPKNNKGSTCRSPLAVDTCRYTNASLKTDRHISQFSYHFPRHWRYREPVCTVGEGRSQHKFIRSFEILCANILTMCKTERLD